jgi:hypothetical protein
MDRAVYPALQTPQAELATASASWDNGGSGYGTIPQGTVYLRVYPTVDMHIVVDGLTSDPAQVGSVCKAEQESIIECGSYADNVAAYVHTKNLSDAAGTLYWTAFQNK